MQDEPREMYLTGLLKRIACQRHDDGSLSFTPKLVIPIVACMVAVVVFSGFFVYELSMQFAHMDDLLMFGITCGVVIVVSVLALRQPSIDFVASTQTIEIGSRKRQVAFDKVQRIVCVHHYRKRTIRGDKPYNKFVVHLRDGKPLVLGRIEGTQMDSRTQLLRNWLGKLPSSRGRFRIDEIVDR